MGMVCLPLYIIVPLPVVLLIVCHGIPQWQAEAKIAPHLAHDEGLSSPERGDFITKQS
ncbi:hypothetical protein [Paenibacillus thiaminolyticus]|uniref:hypothetical protein n=1 Tax=Paenibacillus thiaminolyticus TaxID=49283 RepID=UPI00254318F7|nr:hypothetical protein [Paenibacillus thiaminolyticus]WII38240.1 hypothetical protein O0V01_03610 [Paenibacillus thiaminolyticus]